MNEFAHTLARRLVEIGAVSFSPSEPYTWASGLLSPMYCDNRQTLAYPDIRKLIADGFSQVMAREGLHPEAVIGVATGAIPHAAVLAERMDLPLGYVRGAAKQHGKQNQLEGFNRAGAPIVVVEDLISTGGSSIAAAIAARDAGMNVQAVVAIFTYGFPMAAEAFANEGMPLHALVRLDDLMTAAEEAGGLASSDRATLNEWMSDPVRWSDKRRAGL